MEDEISTVETTTEDESQEQTSTFEVNDSEVDENTTEQVDRGDLRVPLKQERTRRQELEAQLNDPDYIARKASELGFTRQEVSGGEIDIASEVRKQVTIEKARDKYPELRKDEDLQVLVTAMAGKMRTTDFVKAADKVFAKINKANEEAAQKAIEQSQQERIEQEKAQNVSSTTRGNSDDADTERLVKQSKSWDKRVQMKALIELEKRKLTK